MVDFRLLDGLADRARHVREHAQHATAGSLSCRTLQTPPAQLVKTFLAYGSVAFRTAVHHSRNTFAIPTLHLHRVRTAGIVQHQHVPINGRDGHGYRRIARNIFVLISTTVVPVVALPHENPLT